MSGLPIPETEYIIMDGDLPIPVCDLEGEQRGCYFYPVGDDKGYLIHHPRQRRGYAVATGTPITERVKALAASFDLGDDW